MEKINIINRELSSNMRIDSSWFRVASLFVPYRIVPKEYIFIYKEELSGGYIDYLV